MILKVAHQNDAQAICDLLNRAYRGTDGWTTEGALISGHRCVVGDIEKEIQSPETTYLICQDEDSLQACIAVTQSEKGAYLGSFSVLPELQGKGIGKAVLKQAEDFAKSTLKTDCFLVSVLAGRDELFAYYERRGYKRNGNVSPFPTHLDVGMPVNPDQMMEEMVKPLISITH